MLHNFGLLPGETIYSGISAYADFMGNNSVQELGETFFGFARTRPASQIPNGLEYMAGKIVYQKMDSDELIDKHTPLPYYEAYLPEYRSNLIRNALKSKSQANVPQHLGLIASGAVLAKNLNLCHCCAQSDISQFGRAYWHREHQLPGVTVCPKHSLPLIASDVRTATSTRYLSLDQYLSANPDLSPIQSVIPMELRMQIAQSSVWLLQNQPRTVDLSWIRERYGFELAKRKLASYTQHIRVNSLIEKFFQFFSPSIFDELRCNLVKGNNITGYGDTWLSRLLRPSDYSAQPLHHILLCLFLGYSAEQFFILPRKLQYFGSPPWPCLNPFCSQYLKLSIRTCEITFSYQGSRYPIGHFSCHCGFQYSRTGPDSSARMKYFRGEEFGKVFRKSFGKMWSRYRGNIAKIARKLDVPKSRVKSWAEALDLRGSPRIVKTNQELIAKRRTEWLKIIHENPNKGRGALQKIAPKVEGYLFKYDKKWLENNSPSTGYAWRLRPASREQDIQLAWKIREICHDLIKRSDPFVCLSVNRISLEIFKNRHKLVYVMNKKSQTYPRTIRMLVRLSETTEKFALRKLQYWEQVFDQQHVVPSRSALFKAASIEKSSTTNPSISNALDVSIQRLKGKYG